MECCGAVCLPHGSIQFFSHLELLINSFEYIWYANCYSQILPDLCSVVLRIVDFECLVNYVLFTMLLFFHQEQTTTIADHPKFPRKYGFHPHISGCISKYSMVLSIFFFNVGDTSRSFLKLLISADSRTLLYRIPLYHAFVFRKFQLGKMRIQLPCRASTCTHLQCFDATTFLMMNEKKATWMCPVCDKPAPFHKLILDG